MPSDDYGDKPSLTSHALSRREILLGSTTLAAASAVATGNPIAAIFTDHVKASHIIRRVILRQIAILNYINPF
jgi:hypothetical protein